MHKPEFAVMIFPTTRPFCVILPINEPSTSNYGVTYKSTPAIN